MSDTEREYPCGGHPLDIADRWANQSRENVEEWGEQDIETLLIAIQEELGELSQATLEYRSENGTYEPLFEELDDLGALLFQFHGAISAHRFAQQPRSVEPATDQQDDSE